MRMIRLHTVMTGMIEARRIVGALSSEALKWIECGAQ